MPKEQKPRKVLIAWLDDDEVRSKRQVTSVNYGEHLAVTDALEPKGNCQYVLTHMESGSKVYPGPLLKFIAVRMLELLDSDERWELINEDGEVPMHIRRSLGDKVLKAYNQAYKEFILT
jgi:hypothetical protein